MSSGILPGAGPGQPGAAWRSPVSSSLSAHSRWATPWSQATDEGVASARREKYLALELAGSRYDVGVKYGLLMAQMALALTGDDREEVMARLLELLAQRELSRQPA